MSKAVTIPRALSAALSNPGRAAAKRLMDALQTMRRIDIAHLEALQAGTTADGLHTAKPIAAPTRRHAYRYSVLIKSAPPSPIFS